MFAEMTSFIVETVGEWGYLGILVMMAIESSFIPFPSEIVMIPAGYLASKGEMNLVLVLFSGFAGSLIGAWANYLLAVSLGRKVLEKYGKYFFIRLETLEKMEGFFVRHGAISTFTGRLVPGVRQLISIPAGFSKMPFFLFSLYTFLGAAIWSSVLVALGYTMGENEELMREYMREIIIITLVSVGVLIAIYIYIQQRKNKN